MAQDDKIHSCTGYGERNEGIYSCSRHNYNTLHVKVSDCQVPVSFGVFQNLTVIFLLGTFFIDQFVIKIFPVEIKAASCNYKPVPILMPKTRAC